MSRQMVPPAGFEPALTVLETDALSPELREHYWLFVTLARVVLIPAQPQHNFDRKPHSYYLLHPTIQP